jgi:hypothetical protein
MNEKGGREESETRELVRGFPKRVLDRRITGVVQKQKRTFPQKLASEGSSVKSGSGSSVVNTKMERDNESSSAVMAVLPSLDTLLSATAAEVWRGKRRRQVAAAKAWRRRSMICFMLMDDKRRGKRRGRGVLVSEPVETDGTGVENRQNTHQLHEAHSSLVSVIEIK